VSTDRLSTLDATFLWFERPGAPVHVGAIATFEAGPLLDGDGNLRLAELRELIGTRIAAMPRLRRRLAPVPFDLDLPLWVDDPDFDVARHVGELRAPPPGGDAELRGLAGELQSELLPRDRPLWDVRFVTGLSGGRIGLVQRIHHALVDGVSGVDLAALLLDLAPDSPPPGPGPRWSPEQPPGALSLIAAGMRHRLADPARAAAAGAGLVRHPTRAVRAAATAAEGVDAVVAGGAAPHTSLDAPLAGARRLAWVRAALDDVRMAGRPAGGTVNDVVLSAVAGGLRWLLLERSEPLAADLVLKVLVPVSRHGADGHDALGNQVAALYVPLPVGMGDPHDRLAAVARETRRLKSSPNAASSGLLLDAADALPAGVARMLTRALDRQRFVNLVVTNVPGPPVPLYLAGSRMIEAYPVVPLTAHLPVGVAVLSYDGVLTITLTADDGACPDVDVFAAGIERSLAQLGVPAGQAPPA
jgi:diacylglycerol O-acyltransferase / wax synthase